MEFSGFPKDRMAEGAAGPRSEGPSTPAVMAQLERILASKELASSDRLRRFLRFTVEQFLHGNAESLKEYNIGVEVFDRKDSYDPRVDSIVRVEARRLRSKLKLYYKKEGRKDPIVISVPPGGYVPLVRERAASIAAAKEAARAEMTAIAVLPFAAMSPDEENEYFSEGLTEDLIHGLAQLSGLRVVARTSAFQFKGKAHDVREIGERLGVGSVLEGSVRKAGGRIRITAQLISVADGYHLWSHQYDRELRDVFAVQDEISRSIVQTLRIQLVGPPDRPLLKAPTIALAAYEQYVRGRHFCGTPTPSALRKSIQFFERALREDPNYAAAYAGLAEAYGLLALFCAASPREALPKAESAAMQATEIDDELAEAHAMLGYVRAVYRWEWAAAEQEFKRAIFLSPSSVSAHQWYSAVCLTPLGRMDESLAELTRAAEIDPISLMISTNFGIYTYLNRQYDEALGWSRRALEMDPDYYLAHWIAGLAYEQKSMFDDAAEAFLRALDLAGKEESGVPGGLGHCYAASGKPEGAQRVLEELRGPSGRGYISPYSMALLHASLGNKHEACAWLREACESRVPWALYIGLDPRFENLHAEEDFATLLRKMGLRQPAGPAPSPA
jgi:TolB-like protein/Tfp pilus assembly protein PilF